MEKKFNKLHGMRVMLELPTREESKIKLSPEIQQEMDKEFWEKCTKLKVYAVGDAVEKLSEGDEVYLPPNEIRRSIQSGEYLEIDGGLKLIVPQLSIALTW